MHIRLRHALTGLYYRSSGKWTTNPRQAYDFRGIARAVSFARRTHSPNLELDLSFDDPLQAASLSFKELIAHS